MIKKLIQKNRYDALYNYIDYIATIDNKEYYRKTKLIQYILHDGYKLFKASVTFTGYFSKHDWYVAAKSYKEVREIIETMFSYMGNAYKIKISECTYTETEKVLNNPKKYSII